MKPLPGLLLSVLLLTGLPAEPVGQPTAVRFCGAYTIRTYRDMDTGKGSFEIMLGKNRVYEKAGFAFSIASPWGPEKIDVPLIGQDLTNSGAPHVVVYEWTGGAHGANIARVFRLGEECTELAAINGDGFNPGFVEQKPHQPWLMLTRDLTFSYWPHGYAASHFPKIILRWNGHRYIVARELMMQPAPSNSTLQKIAAQVRAAASWNAELEEYPYELYSTAIDLMYSGHENLAWQFLREAWKPGFPGLEKFAADLRNHRDASEYWQQFVKTP